ncbi:hypothetical protein [Desulfosporosinus youngiae]|uniref:Uncharacterized protein n=1 Tax=Desulfosporosinus youngiae DSM 17734 TaxID=768710 RepID=H5XZR5_9FIRM|nr:hypothetical protein [Desulfosporosinus youngiae]EHQ92111.1 hypothetical protein DesyoDRAFT_5180 [Desulfosporosinus youngiae DSM 17734]
MPTARTKANRKYNEKAYDRIPLTVKKGEKEVIQAFAEKKGLSVNAFVNAAIQEKMNPAPVKAQKKKDPSPKAVERSGIVYTMQDLMRDWDHYIYVHSLDPSQGVIADVKDDLIRNLFPKGAELAEIGIKTQYICPFTGKKFGSIENLIYAAIPKLISWREAEAEREGLLEKQKREAAKMAKQRQRLIDEGKFPKF